MLCFDTKPDFRGGARPWRVHVDAITCPMHSKAAKGASKVGFWGLGKERWA